MGEKVEVLEPHSLQVQTERKIRRMFNKIYLLAELI